MSQSRLSFKEAQEIIRSIARESGINPVKLKKAPSWSEYEYYLYSSTEKNLLWFKWYSCDSDPCIRTDHLEDLIKELEREIEKQNAYVDPRCEEADKLRAKYFDKLLTQKLT